MNCQLITTASDLSKCYQLKRSLEYFGWKYHFIEHEWKGFGDKIIKTYEYLKSHPEITHFFYSDAWDTFALSTMEEALNKIPDQNIILFSAERACYPNPEKASRYPESASPWKYLNGGGWFASSELFIKMVEAYPLTPETVDQVYFTDRFLEGTNGIVLDYQCSIFQTVAFCPYSDFEIMGYHLWNKITNVCPTFIHGNGHTPIHHIYNLIPMADNLKEAVALWSDTPDAHKALNEAFTENVNANPKLKGYRDWIEEKIFGFGERSFLWMWKLIVDELPTDFNFLEIGVFRGQILGAIRMLAPKAKVTGITPLTSEGGHWESDYAADIALLHKTFKLKQPKIIKGLSTDAEVIEQAGKDMYDAIYIDGGHSYDVAKSDIYKYSSFVKVGGYLVIDDCANKYNLPEGYFKGIDEVSRAVDELLPNDYYRELFSVVHNRVFQRIK